MGEFGHGIISMSVRVIHEIIGLYVSITLALIAFYVGIFSGMFVLTFLGIIQNCMNLKRIVKIWRKR